MKARPPHPAGLSLLADIERNQKIKQKQRNTSLAKKFVHFTVEAFHNIFPFFPKI